MTSKMLQKKMKMNIVMRNGMNLRPSGPMVCMMISSLDELDRRPR